MHDPLEPTIGVAANPRRDLCRRLLGWARDSRGARDFDGVVGLGAVGGGELECVLSAGLGPMLHRATATGRDRLPVALRDTLVAADLTARVRHAGLVQTACEAIDACARLGVRVTLLKGISISGQCYPEDHFRPMGDIDVLLPRDAVAVAEAELMRLGYERPPFDALPGLHHSPPLRHPGRDNWIELHHRLFGDASDVGRGRLFEPALLSSRSVETRFEGRDALRLCDELQLAYIAASWFEDLKTYRFHASFLPSMFDAVLLLNHERAAIDWDRLVSWLDNPVAAASLYVLLCYLATRRLAVIDERTLERVRKRQRFVGSLQLRLMLAHVDRYLVEGRSWGLPWPPSMPCRYSVRYQFEKRVLGRWSRWKPA